MNVLALETVTSWDPSSSFPTLVNHQRLIACLVLSCVKLVVIIQVQYSKYVLPWH